jgi:hypothetical protein
MTKMNSNQPTTNSDEPLCDAVVELTGKDGNGFLILGLVCRGIRSSNHPELEQAFMNEAMEGDYDHLLQTCMRYVTVE